MNRKLLWAGIGLLLGLNLFLLYQVIEYRDRAIRFERSANLATLGAPESRSELKALELITACAPYSTEAEGETEAPGGLDERLAVHLYFSLTKDCLSCVQAEIDKLNGALERGQLGGMEVRGFTEVDGTMAQRTLSRDLKPDFSVTDVVDIRDLVARAGAPSTPFLALVDRGTGRILLGHLPASFDKADMTFLDRVTRLVTECE